MGILNLDHLTPILLEFSDLEPTYLSVGTPEKLNLATHNHPLPIANTGLIFHSNHIWNHCQIG